MVFTSSGLSSSSRTSLLERRSLVFDSSLTPIQQQVDGLVEGFVREATRPTTLASMMAGSAAYRFARIGVMGLPMGTSASLPLRALSYAAGLGSEVTAFEGTSRFFASISGSSNPHLWTWGGEGGWGQGLATSAITFGTLRGAGFAAREQNLILQHFLQSGAMVAGHQLAARVGIAERPEGSLAEQFLHAEATNLQLAAGMGLLHGMTPGLHAWEAGLEVSLRVHERNLIEGRRPSFLSPLESPIGVGVLSSAESQGRESFGQEARDLNLQMAGSSDGKGKPPRGTSRRDLERAKTVRNLPGLTGEPLRRLSNAETLEMYSPGNPYTFEGIPAGTRLVRVAELLSSTSLVSKTLGLIEKNLGPESPSLVVHLGDNELNTEAQGILKVDMNRVFREKEIPEGSLIAILVPKKNQAFLFQKEGNFSRMKTLRLQSPSERALSTVLNPEKVPWEASTPYGILLFLKRALENEAPAIRYSGDVWKEERDAGAVAGRLRSQIPLKPNQVFTLFLEARRERVVFFWEGDRVRWRTEPLSPPRSSASKDSASAKTARQQATTQPEFPKVSPSKTPLILAAYEAEAELRITDLMRSVFQSDAKSRLDTRESGSSFRGNHLARVAGGILKTNSKYEALSAQDREVLEEVHRLLQKAYTFFDFGTLQSFTERLGRARLLAYQSFVDGYNRDAEREGWPSFTPLDGMPTNPMGSESIPKPDHIREQFLRVVLRQHRQELKPHDVLQFVQSPETLGRTFTMLFIAYLETFLSKVGEIRQMPRENLNRLFDAKRDDLSKEALSLREDVLTLLKDMQEYRRILMEGKGNFHRRFLRIPFHHSPHLADLYPKFHKILSQGIPAEVLINAGLQRVPTLEQLQNFSKPQTGKP